MTEFIHTDVSLSCGAVLTVDGNSKITAGNGSYHEPKPNAFSLPHISTCPGATAICQASCYVHGLEKHAPDVYAAYRRNEQALHRVLLSDRSFESSAQEFADWISEHCQGGFRWHVSGDLVSRRHAAWVVSVSLRSNAPMWIYTRSLDLVPDLVRGDLVVNVSTDAETYPRAKAVASACGVRLCYLCHDGTLPDDLPAGSVIFPDYKLRGRDLAEPTTAPWWQGLTANHKKMVCPADFFGQSEQHRCGPCKKCLVKL